MLSLLKEWLADGASRPRTRSRVLALTIAVLIASSQVGWGATPLLEAARSNDTAAAVAAIEENADVNAAAPDGTTALHWAVHFDDVELIERLLEAGAAPTVANDYGATPLSEAAIVANARVLELLLDAGADLDSPNAEGQTALMVVARTSNVEAAALLLARGADVNARERRKGQTALMWAVAQSRPDMAALLIEHGANVDERSKVNDWERRVTAEPRAKQLPPGGFTPLLYAARQECLECTRLLVEAGADVDLPNPDSVTPLLMALLSANFDVARYLLERGANVNKWDWWGRNPLYAAVDYNTVPHGGRPDRPAVTETSSLEMIELLLEAGANPNAQLKLWPPYRSVRADRGADSILGIGTTPLIRAAKAGDTAAMRLLFAHGALPDLPQEDGVTALMAAAGLYSRDIDTRGRFQTEHEAIEAARLILAAGGAVDARDERGRTALHAAAAQGRSALVQFLLDHGADPGATDAGGATPLDAALGRMSGRGRGGGGEVHEETAALLRESGNKRN